MIKEGAGKTRSLSTNPSFKKSIKNNNDSSLKVFEDIYLCERGKENALVKELKSFECSIDSFNQSEGFVTTKMKDHPLRKQLFQNSVFTRQVIPNITTIKGEESILLIY